MSKELSVDAIPGEIRTLVSKLANDPTRKLVEREVMSVYALVSYVSYNLKIKEAEIIKVTCKSFCVSKIEDIPQTSYNDLILYIMDFTHPSSMKN